MLTSRHWEYPTVRYAAQARLTYDESVTARMAQPNAGGPATTSVVTSRAPRGSTPEGLVRTTTDAVVEFGQGPGWRAGLIGHYRRLLDDAADSPIVADVGDRDQYFDGAVGGCRC